MKNFVIFIGLLTILVLIGRVFLNIVKDEDKTQPQVLVPPTTYEYFWSKTCPHCAKVDQFLQSWNGGDKIQMQKFEVNESSDNAMKFYQRGTFCQIPKNELGVPLLLTPEGECFLGDEPIISYFESVDIGN